MEIKIGTRGSNLALAQAESVRKALAVSFPMHTFSLNKMLMSLIPVT